MAFEIYIRKGTLGTCLLMYAQVESIIDENNFAELVLIWRAKNSKYLFLLQVVLFSCCAR